MKPVNPSFEVLDKVDLVSIDCAIWSGWKRLHSSDIEIGVGGRLPPKEVTTLGSKRTINPDDIAIFNALKKRAHTACLKVGARFLNGFVIPREKTVELSTKLEEIAEVFAEEKNKLLRRYDHAVESWITQHADFQQQLRDAIVPLKEVEERLSFEYSVFRVAATAETAGDLGNQVNRLGSQLLHESAAEASKCYESSFTGSAGINRKASRKTLNSVWRIREKLAGLAFLDESVEPMVKAIDAFFEAAPKTGPIEGALYDQALALVLILSDPDKVRRHANVGLEAAGLTASVLDLDEKADPLTEDAVVRAKSMVQAPTQESLYF
jgi:hypothetical protein